MFGTRASFVVPELIKTPILTSKMTTPITEEASDEATTALRHLSQRIEVDYQERVAMIDKTCQSMFDWLKTVEPHLSRHENPSSHVVEFEEMVQS